MIIVYIGVTWFSASQNAANQDLHLMFRFEIFDAYFGSYSQIEGYILIQTQGPVA